MDEVKNEIRKIIEPLYMDAGGDPNTGYDGYDQELANLFISRLDKLEKEVEYLKEADRKIPYQVILRAGDYDPHEVGHNAAIAQVIKVIQKAKEN